MGGRLLYKLCAASLIPKRFGQAASSSTACAKPSVHRRFQPLLIPSYASLYSGLSRSKPLCSKYRRVPAPSGSSR